MSSSPRPIVRRRCRTLARPGTAVSSRRQPSGSPSSVHHDDRDYPASRPGIKGPVGLAGAVGLVVDESAGLLVEIDELREGDRALERARPPDASLELLAELLHQALHGSGSRR